MCLLLATLQYLEKSLCAHISAIHCMSLNYSILLHCVLVTNDPIEITVPSISQHETATLAYGSWCTKTNRQLCKGVFINVVHHFPGFCFALFWFNSLFSIYKGQLISKCPFGVIVLTQIPNELGIHKLSCFIKKYIKFVQNLISPKDQLISKCPFGVIVWTKIPTKFFPRFLP